MSYPTSHYGHSTPADRDHFASELRQIDAVLARRPALEDKWSRIDKIGHAVATAAERDRLVEVNEGLVEGLVEIEASSSCYCARDVDGQRLGCKCPICVARATLSNARKPKSP